MLRCFLLFVTFMLGFGSGAWATGRDQQLRELSAGHRKLAATSPGSGEPVGTAFNEIGVPEFTCATLAFVFDKDAIFERLGKIDTGPADQEASVATDLVSLLHENWALAAEHVLTLTDRDRIELWNLNCVGQHGIGKEHYLGSGAPAADFIITDYQLRVLGDINDSFFERFAAALARSPSVKTIALGSGGGNVRDAILAGTLIRQRGLDTTLYADCNSACTLMFMGGVNRTVWSPYPRLGFHQVSRAGQAVAKTDPVYGLIRNYVDAMGGLSDAFIDFMYRAEPTDMFYPEVWDLCKPGVTSWVQRGC